MFSRSVDRPDTGSRNGGDGISAIRARDVDKAFRLRHERRSTVRDLLLRPVRAKPTGRIEALREVSIDVGQGEFLGIVGRNGSGKSTLLRCLAGIYPIDAGELEVHGRVAPFIELGVGFNPDLAARDNVVINAVMLGLSPREARRHFDEIIDFAELRGFADLKLKNFSSGMIVRLAFAVTVHVNADILLFDEVLAVGDAAFQQKCFDRFQQLKDAGLTVLLVTHEMSLVERFCDRAVLLDSGRVVQDGDPVAVARRYGELNAAAGVRATGGMAARLPETGAAILSAWFEDEEGNPIRIIAQGERCRACVEVSFGAALHDPVLELTLRDSSRRPVFATSSRWAHGPTGSYDAGDAIVARISFENCFAPGRYSLSASVSEGEGGLLDESGELTELNIYGPRSTGGIADLPHEFEIALR